MAIPTRASSRSARLLSRLAPLEPSEIPAVVAAFCLFFCFWAGYFAVRPVRETVGTLLGRERVADLWVATWIASLAIVPVYGTIVARFKRSTLIADQFVRDMMKVPPGRFFPQIMTDEAYAEAVKEEG